MKKILRSKSNWLRTSQIVTALIMGLTVLTTVHAKSDKSRGVITLEVAKVDGECRVLIQSEKPISNVIFNLDSDIEKTVEYVYEVDEFGNMTSSLIGNTYDLGEYVVGSALEDDYMSIHVKAGNNGKRGVGENVIDYEVAVAEECQTITYEIGATGPGGGIVFYVDPDDATMGLEAAPADQTPEVWCSPPTDIEGVDNLESAGSADNHSGSKNTPLIEAVCGASSAAGVAASYEWPNGQTDGFLPNKEELHLLFLQRDEVGGFAGNGNGYWSSSEFVDTNDAWFQAFDPARQGTITKLFNLRVRAVRAF